MYAAQSIRANRWSACGNRCALRCPASSDLLRIAAGRESKRSMGRPNQLEVIRCCVLCGEFSGVAGQAAILLDLTIMSD